MARDRPTPACGTGARASVTPKPQLGDQLIRLRHALQLVDEVDDDGSWGSAGEMRAAG